MQEAREERHDNTKNPSKGKGDGNFNARLLNLVLAGDRKFREAVMARLDFNRSVQANTKARTCSRAISPLSQSSLLECVSHTSVSRTVRVSDEHEGSVLCRTLFR